MEINNKTAVQWLVDEINHCKEENGFIVVNPTLLQRLFEQAESMFEKQMKEAVLNQVTSHPRFRKLFEEQFEQWYDYTYSRERIDKEEQKKLITEIMEEDAKDGLYEMSSDEIDFMKADLSPDATPPKTEISDEVEIIMDLAEKSRNALNDVAHLCNGEVEEHIFDMGFYQGYKTKDQTEISDNDIERMAELRYPIKEDIFRDLWSENMAFIEGMKTYREQLKSK